MRVPPAVRFVLLHVLLVACGSEEVLQSSSRLDASTSPASACFDGGCLAPTGVVRSDASVSTARRLLNARIDPAEAALSSVDGSQPTQAFRVLGIYSDGVERELSQTLLLDESGVGALTGNTFVANGAIGGPARVQTSVLTHGGVSVTASALVTVQLTKTVLGAGVPADVAQRFAATPLLTDSTRAAGLVYPLDGAVVPQNLFPIDVQWTRGVAGDLFHVSWEKPHVRVEAYLSYEPPRHWAVELEAFRALARSDVELPASVRVERLEVATGQRIGEAPRTLSFAKTALTGSVYYWETDTARLQRIDDGSGKAVSFMPSPPVTNDPSACVGCHSISHSGRYLAGRLGSDDSLGAVFDLTTDLTVDPAPTVWPVGPSNLRWWFSSWSPDDTQLIVSVSKPPELRLYDPLLGTRLAATGLPLGTMPSWSPDGQHIAYVANPNHWGDQLSAGDIGLLDVLAGDAFANPRVIHSGNTLAGGPADSYPSWSPDSQSLAFAHGSGARSEINASQLFVIKPEGTGLVPLTRASSGTLDDFQPSFSPFSGGGYFWLTFLSRRVYGNESIGNQPRPEAKRQQIWVTAIRTDAAPGTDPSSVPFWLPGQDTRTANISAVWAPRPCRTAGTSCAVGGECCSGDCRPGASGALVCSPPPVERCVGLYEACASGADCCNGSCRDRVCAPQPI